jgi:hypothetical protein
MTNLAAITPRGGLWLAVILVGLGLGAELLSFDQFKDSAASAAVIPFAAAVLIAPSATTVAMIVAAEVVAQGLHKRAFIKAVFNLAQHTIGLSIAVIVLHWTGAPPFMAVKGTSFTECLKLLLLPTVLLVASVQFCQQPVRERGDFDQLGSPILPLWTSHLRLGATNVLVNVVITFM